MKNPKFVIKTAADGKPYFTLQAANGQVLVTSETYESKDNAYKGILSVLTSVAYTGVDDEDFVAEAPEEVLLKAVKQEIRIDDQTL